MSERFSAALRSNPPLSLKRRRAEDSDSGGSTARSGCRYQGCNRPGKVENGDGAHLPFCGVRHRNFGMADLYDMRTQGGALTNQKPPGICKLPGCDAPVWVIDATAGEAYDFCKRRHAKEYVQLITEQWELADRVCKFEPCSNHVHVDEKTKEPSNYCGHEHDFAASAAMGKLAAVEKRKQEAAAAKGGSSASQDALIVRPSGTGGGIGPTWGDDLGQKNIPLGDPQQNLQRRIEQARGCHSRNLNEDIEKCLERLYMRPGDFEYADPNGLFYSVKNVTDLHPWEIVHGFVPRYLLLCIDSTRGSQRSTIEGFGWKQTSSKYGNKSTDEQMMTTYFSYERKEKGESKHGHSGEVVDIYRKYQDEWDLGMHRNSHKRWRLLEHSLSDEYVKILTGGKLPNQKWVVSKIFQNKKGLPACPPLPVKEETRGKEMIGEDNNVLGPLRIIPEAPRVGETGITSSISSDTSSPGEGLSAGGGGTHGTNSNETEGSEDLAWQELIPNPLNVPDEIFGDVPFLAEEGAMISSSLSTNVSPVGGLPPGGMTMISSSLSTNVSPVGGLPPGGMMLPGPNYDETGEVNGSNFFLDDALVTSQEIETMLNGNNAHMGTFPETGSHVEEMGITRNISSGAAQVEGLLPGGGTSQGCNYCNRTGEFDGYPFLQDSPTSLDYIFEQSRWCVDGDAPLYGG